jgi:hypothetical membrane protein
VTAPARGTFRTVVAWGGALVAIANLALVVLGLYTRRGHWSDAMAAIAGVLGAMTLLCFTQTAMSASTRRLSLATLVAVAITAALFVVFPKNPAEF